MQSKYTINYKKYILENDGLQYYYSNRKRLKEMLVPLELNDGVIVDCPTEQYYNYKAYLDTMPEYDCARRLIKSKQEKTKKVKERITDIVINNNAVFVTLTFNDDILQRTSKETRRRYVSRYLKSQCSVYVANIDYGADFGREHYHAVVNGRINPQMWLYGALNVQKMHNTSKDAEKISKYITKLTLHAVKHTTKNEKLIYSKNVNL